MSWEGKERSLRVLERDESGHLRRTTFGSDGKQYKASGRYNLRDELGLRVPSLDRIRRVLVDLFLPAGYPASVTPDYLPYHAYNALQAFFSSLAGLIASRGALQGVGVGDASATATSALLLTVLQDVFGRITTISAAYVFGTSLYPETKTFRLVADLVNDASIVLDTLCPRLSLSFLHTFLLAISLCASAALRALCGLVAGGSKAALTNHFACTVPASTAAGGEAVVAGDVGELNAKDASRETVVGLFGMLLGTLLVPRLTSVRATWLTLVFLIAGHLLANYLAVRSVSLRTLNRQRAGILWTAWAARMREREDADDVSPSISSLAKAGGQLALTPAEVSRRERILALPGTLRDARGHSIGYCELGASVSRVVARGGAENVRRALQSSSDAKFAKERYMLFALPRRRVESKVELTVCFKEGATPRDQLKAWAHALEAAARLRAASVSPDTNTVVEEAYAAVEAWFAPFMEALSGAGWRVDAEGIMMGSIGATVLGVEGDAVDDGVVLDGEAKVKRE
ncbi:DUF647-domain-containing protein [Coniophora puteana RWD-64-598 SS2]|uniref:DUF647-domain-containing protein n=1 Tax=Coniophora puteana (strain RWD-64-598) TaxID=741705 RepID=R7SEW2_CONPW|nr:DUF647-domain-containing protein [Coniophora puteana RWD-64-598 SS2]EIW74420.1 DUF647-domain-containing protein [Coniophora puteana RWD-64-598 SS2]